MPGNCEETITLTGDLHARPAGALSVAAAEATVTKGAMLLAVYSLGLGIPFLLAAFASVVIGHGSSLTESERVNHTVERDVVVFSQVAPDGFGAALAELAIFHLAAIG